MCLAKTLKRFSIVSDFWACGEGRRPRDCRVLSVLLGGCMAVQSPAFKQLPLNDVFRAWFPSRQLSALSDAWSSNLPDYLTTLALIQSNNGEPNWGPNHATKHTVELLNQSGSTSSYITLLMETESGRTPECGIHPLITSLSRASGQVCMPTCKTCWCCFFSWQILSVFCVGGELSKYQLLQCSLR